MNCFFSLSYIPLSAKKINVDAIKTLIEMNKSTLNSISMDFLMDKSSILTGFIRINLNTLNSLIILKMGIFASIDAL